MSNLIAITGPAYSGKTTLINHLKEDYNYVIPRHITTRKERIDDEPGFYRYVSVDDYNKLLDYNYAAKIIKFYKTNAYSLSTIKNYCYFYIIKVLLEKLYYSNLYDLNLESNSQKKDYWLWWYNLLKEIKLIDIK